jgi:uncharacterized membrane protein
LDQPQETVEIDEVAKDLSILCAQVRTGLVGFEGNHALLQLAVACQKVADELAVLLARIRQEHGHRKRWASFRQALRSILKKEEIKSLQNRLHALRSQIDTQLLTILG